MSAPAPPDLLARKARGAFFTPPAIARFLADWAIAKNSDARVLDPTCGDGVFLLAAGERLRELGATRKAITEQVTGVDVHGPSLRQAESYLEEDRLGAKLVRSDFFDQSPPAQLGARLGWYDAVIGNPPFVRYQEYGVEARKRAASAALAQGVRLSGLASSWAPLLVHASGFVKSDGRLAMVMPAELLTVGYAEPIRRWLRSRFGRVNLVMFAELQFAHAEEQVVLLVAEGSGGCDSFTLWQVRDAKELAERHIFDASSAALRDDGKWTDLLLPSDARQLFRKTATEDFARLDSYGTPELGTVTGANHFFTLTEATRREHNLDERLLLRISPPGTKHLRGLTFSASDWEELRDSGHRVWLLCPDPHSRSTALRNYVALGEAEGVHEAYKCAIRKTWWRPPVVPKPDLFFTYMSHRYPRLIANHADVTILNSMHGMRLVEDAPGVAPDALPLLILNSVTMLGAEVMGRSYGGGVLKMEPREAASLPVPAADHLNAAWSRIRVNCDELDAELRRGEWVSVVQKVDDVLLRDVIGLDASAVTQMRDAAALLRVRRTRKTEDRPPDGKTSGFTHAHRSCARFGDQGPGAWSRQLNKGR